MKIITFSISGSDAGYFIVFSALLLHIIGLTNVPVCFANDFADTVTLQEWNFTFTEADNGRLFPEYFDTLPSEKIQIPHCFNLNETLKNHREGLGWYTTTVKFFPEDTVDYILEFDGVCLRAKVFIDGVFAGESRHAYLPFTINLSHLLKNKRESHITLCIDNKLLKNDFPDHNCNGWWIYGGLIREVSLLTLPKMRIENCQFRTMYIADSTFKLTISCDSRTVLPDSMLLSVVSPEGKTLLKHQFTGQVCTLIVQNVSAWTPENPVLYNMTLTPYWGNRPGEPFRIKRGFSHLHIVDGSLHLNGKPIFLRGIGRHDVKGDKGPLLTREERCVDLLAIKSTGANMLRIAHFPQHPDVYELCDSLGLIVMDEMPAWKTYPGFLGKEEGQQQAADYMESLIRSHGNYTSIGLWCIANEIHSVKNRVALYVKYMADYVRKTDPSRLVTYTSYNYQFDKAYQYVDVISVNEYFGWYLGSIDMLPSLFEAIQKECPGKPMIISEFGSSSAFGNFNKDAMLPGPVKSVFTKDFSEDFQGLFHEKQIEAIWKKRDICNGAVAWCYNDFMEYRKKPNATTLPHGLNGMGIVTKDRKKKLAFNVIRKSFHNIRKKMRSAGGY